MRYAARANYAGTAGTPYTMTEPVGEDSWLALVDEASRTAGDLEQRIGVVELYKQALNAEPWSNKLWLAYCEWVWSLHTDCQNGDAGWPEEEQALGQELFSTEMALGVWQEGAYAIQYRLNDSHELWNRWILIEQRRLSKAPTKDNIERIRSLFLDRLQIPHLTWDDTSTMFSSFITTYDEASYESTMVKTTKLAKQAKALYSERETQEIQLKRASESGDAEAFKATFLSYLGWESEQAIRKTKKGVPLAPSILSVALYERALTSTSLRADAAVWEDYIVFITSPKLKSTQTQLPDVLLVVQRATRHCPWSGTLWAKYILLAEARHLPFETMEQIKHTATNNRELDRDGMGGVVEFYVAWVGFLNRRTMVQGATETDIDIAEMGLPTALESVHEWGQKRDGKEWKGDPLFRIERIFIQYLTQQGQIEKARGLWRRLVNSQGDGYQFWQQYYMWEMTVRPPVGPPSLATAVLNEAISRRNLDWPEGMMEIFIRHCNNYEEVGVLLETMATVHRLSKQVAQRRAKQLADQAVLYAQQAPVAVEAEIEDETPSGSSKRKRDSATEEGEGSAKKKVKSAAEQEALHEQHLKRDRENTTVIVSNLPPDVPSSKVRQYFKPYGHINSLTLRTEADKSSTTGLVEFQDPSEAQSALLRDGKYYTDRQIQVKAGTGLTLYVTNFPPTADDHYLRNLFKDCGEIFSIRWPSLKKDSHRRFCYMTFKTAEGAADATKLDGKSLGGVYKLNAKYSDPANKKVREGAIAEGREIHLTGVDRDLKENDLKEVFSKYGKVERIRILKTLEGNSKGAAFIVFETKEQANAALDMNNTKLKSSVLTAELSQEKKFKQTATITGKASSASPAPDADGDSVMSRSPGPESHKPSKEDLNSRTIAVLNIPDTVNDARVRALAEPYGEIVKLVLRLDHQGAIIEYSDASMAGRAALGLENHEITPGRRLKTGNTRDLFASKEEFKTDRLEVPKATNKPAFMAPPAPVRRPVGPGGRGGLGTKRGLGFSAAKASTSASTPAAAVNTVNGSGTADDNKKPKSNADFRAMFVKEGAGNHDNSGKDEK